MVREAFSEGDQAFLQLGLPRRPPSSSAVPRTCALRPMAACRSTATTGTLPRSLRKLPVLGALMRLLRRKLAASWKLADEADMRWLRGVLLILAMSLRRADACG